MAHRRHTYTDGPTQTLEPLYNTQCTCRNPPCSVYSYSILSTGVLVLARKCRVHQDIGQHRVQDLARADARNTGCARTRHPASHMNFCLPWSLLYLNQLQQTDGVIPLFLVFYALDLRLGRVVHPHSYSSMMYCKGLSEFIGGKGQGRLSNLVN